MLVPPLGIQREPVAGDRFVAPDLGQIRPVTDLVVSVIIENRKAEQVDSKTLRAVA